MWKLLFQWFNFSNQRVEEAGRADAEQLGGEPLDPQLRVHQDQPVDRVAGGLDTPGWFQTHLHIKYYH